MRKGQGRWHVLYGKTGKPRHLDANVEKGGRSGILCPVTPPGAPRLCPILSSWCPPTRWTKQNTIPTSFRRRTTYLSPPFLSLLRSRRTSRRRRLRSRLYTRNRNSAATRKCLAFLRPVQSPEDSFFRLYFEPGMPIDTIHGKLGYTGTVWSTFSERRKNAIVTCPSSQMTRRSRNCCLTGFRDGFPFVCVSPSIFLSVRYNIFRLFQLWLSEE